MSTNKQDTIDSIKSFISNVANKDYNKANEFLHKTIENKLKERVQQTLAAKN